MKSFLIISVALFLAYPLSADNSVPAVVRKDALYAWENVGEITSISGKTVSIRRTLRLSEATWSLLPGAASDASQLQPGDRIHAKGSTLPDGVYDSRRIFFISQSTPPSSVSTGANTIQAADHGGPDAKDPTRGLGYPGGPGVDFEDIDDVVFDGILNIHQTHDLELLR